MLGIHIGSRSSAIDVHGGGAPRGRVHIMCLFVNVYVCVSVFVYVRVAVDVYLDVSFSAFPGKQASKHEMRGRLRRGVREGGGVCGCHRPAHRGPSSRRNGGFKGVKVAVEIPALPSLAISSFCPTFSSPLLSFSPSLPLPSSHTSLLFPVPDLYPPLPLHRTPRLARRCLSPSPAPPWRPYGIGNAAICSNVAGGLAPSLGTLALHLPWHPFRDDSPA